MVISKSQIQVTTINAILALVLGIGAIFAIFYNAQASNVKAVSEVSERVVKLETTIPELNRRLGGIEGNIQTITSVVLKLK